MIRGSTTAATALRMICAAALFLIGFAHEVPAATDSSAGNPIVFALPDGSFPILCTTVSDSSEPGHDHGTLFKHGCEACRLAASIILPDPDQGAWLGIQHASLANPLIADTDGFGARGYYRANSRAPPVAFRAS